MKNKSCVKDHSRKNKRIYIVFQGGQKSYHLTNEACDELAAAIEDRTVRINTAMYHAIPTIFPRLVKLFKRLGSE